MLLAGSITNIAAQNNDRHGTLVTETVTSIILRDNRIGIDPKRNIKVYLSPDYTRSNKVYPVVYYCHNIGQKAEQVFADGRVAQLLDRAFTTGVSRDFIFVVADYSSPTTGGMFENSSTSGRWLDFTVQELIPFIDTKYRTIHTRDSRAAIGHFMGGRGALKLGMAHADIVGVVYALHPVATGRGQLPWNNLEVDWKKVHAAKTFQDLVDIGGSAAIMVAICQAFLPNPDRPPFYCDFFKELQNGEPVLHVENTQKAQQAFLLDGTVNEAAQNLRSLRGLAFDWARYDPTTAHTHSALEFTRKLDDLGIDHEAEEYRGDPWNKLWTDDGRFYTRLLPFLNQHLIFHP